MSTIESASANTAKADQALSVRMQLLKYLALSFGLTWPMLMLAIKLHAREEFLNFGTAGPALTAMMLSFRGQADFTHGRWKRAGWFFLFLAVCWIVLSLHYLWRFGNRLEFRLDPLLIAPSAFPAWILSGFYSRDAGTRALLQRLIHRPNRWSLVALVGLPGLVLVISSLAYMFGARLAPPTRGPFTFAVANTAAFFLYNLLFVAVHEEPGQRGFFLDHLLSRFSPLSASMMVWLPWALWHLPLDYYRPARWTWVQYILLRVAFMIPTTIVLTWFYRRSGRSIHATVLFHASMNTIPFGLPYFPPAWAVIFIWAIYAIVKDRMWRSQAAPAGA